MIFDKWFKSSYVPEEEEGIDDEALLGQAWDTHADELSKNFHASIFDTDNTNAVEAFLRDAENTVYADFRLSPKDMKAFTTKLRTRLLNERVTMRDYDDVLGQEKLDAWDKAKGTITDPNTDAFGPYPAMTTPYDAAQAQEKEEQRLRERREKNLEAMNAAYDAVERRVAQARENGVVPEEEIQPIVESPTLPASESPRECVHDEDDRAIAEAMDKVMEGRVVRGQALLDAYRAKYHAVNAERIANGQRAFDAKTENQTEDTQRRQWWSGIFSRKGFKKIVAAITFGGFVLSQGVVAQDAYAGSKGRGAVPHFSRTIKTAVKAKNEHVTHLSQTAKTPVAAKDRTIEARRDGAVLGPVKEGDTVSEMIRQYLERKGFLDGVPDGKSVAQMVGRVVQYEKQRVRGQWKDAGIVSGDIGMIQIGEKITLRTLTDEDLLRQWQAELQEGGGLATSVQAQTQESTRTKGRVVSEQVQQEMHVQQPENFANVVVPQPLTVMQEPADTTQIPAQSKDSAAQSGGVDGIFTQPPYRTGEQRLTVEGTMVENDHAVLGRNIRLFTERILGRDAVYKNPVANKTMGEIIAGSTDPQHTKQILEGMSVATGVPYNLERTKWNVFLALIFRANKAEEAIAAVLQQPELAAEQPAVAIPQEPLTQRETSSPVAAHEQQRAEEEGNSVSRHFDQQFRAQSFMERSLAETQAYQDFLEWVGDAAYRDFIARNQDRPQAQSEWEQQVERYYNSFVKRAQQETRAQQRQAVENGHVGSAERREKQAVYMAALQEQVMQHPGFPQLLEANRQLQNLFHKYASTLKQVVDPKDFAEMTEGNPYVEQWVAKARGPLTDEELQQQTLASLQHIGAVQSSFGVERPSNIPPEVLKLHDRNIAEGAVGKSDESVAQLGRDIQITVAKINAINDAIEKTLQQRIQ